MDIIINNTLFTGKLLIHLPTVDSTNNYAKAYIAKNSPIDGTVILADEQFAGRGQVGNTWIAESHKNLTFSIIYKTDFLLASEQFWLNKAISIGIAVATSKFIQNKIPHQPNRIAVKWPNDIFYDANKMAGILIENTIQGLHLKYSIIGIGFNINQTYFPENIRATSLHTSMDSHIDKYEFLEQLLSSIEKYLLLLKNKHFETLKQLYTNFLYQYNCWADYQKGDSCFKGKILDVDAMGYLQMETANGMEQFGFKEIRFIV
ncbi:MAG: biotin--[acetyl-CoA-carboxylase] ligase [Chitinophagales bacterium]